MPCVSRPKNIELAPQRIRPWSRQPAYTFSLYPRDQAGSRILSEMTGNGINLVANALAQSADHIESFFETLRTELAVLRRLSEPARAVCRRQKAWCVSLARFSRESAGTALSGYTMRAFLLMENVTW